jgi:hypothetical protein
MLEIRDAKTGAVIGRAQQGVSYNQTYLVTEVQSSHVHAHALWS